MSAPVDPKLLVLCRQLYARHTEAIVVPRADFDVSGLDLGPHKCHQNVTDWVAANPEYRTVRGWLYFDLSALPLLGSRLFALFGMTNRPIARFLAHSVVQHKNGLMSDITPHAASQQYPFIVHQGTEAEYARLIEDNALVHLDLDLGSGAVTIYRWTDPAEKRDTCGATTGCS